MIEDSWPHTEHLRAPFRRSTPWPSALGKPGVGRRGGREAAAMILSKIKVRWFINRGWSHHHPDTVDPAPSSEFEFGFVYFPFGNHIALFDYLLVVTNMASLITLLSWLTLLIRLWHLLRWLVEVTLEACLLPISKLGFKPGVQAPAPLKPSTCLSFF